MLIALPVWPRAGSVVKAINKANEYGFDYVEISLDYPWPEKLRGKTLEEIKEAKAKYGVELAIHAPWRDVSLASPRPILREAALKLFDECLEFASKLSPLYFNLHVASREAWTIEGVRKALEEAAVRSIKHIAEKARQLGIEITVENNPDPLFGVPSMLKPMVEIEGVKLCLDVGHVAYARWTVEHRGMDLFKEEAVDLEEWVKTFKGKVLVGHLHDYAAEDHSFQDHLLPGTGSADVKKDLSLLKEAGCSMILLEVHWAGKRKPAKFKDLARALNIIKPLIK
ncbi:MAG: hypothetical protein DRJ98_00155 [Thermoprotei archaeon]|nr:MAG: hypothetical protein DRJ98_00155 [Thermoprotei archaeon]RLF18506.1 MAG: hypothetical protein DRN06_01340 [Thermoprotei archaeon]